MPARSARRHRTARYDWAIIEAIVLGLPIAQLISLRPSRQRDREAEMAKRRGTYASRRRGLIRGRVGALVRAVGIEPTLCFQN